MEIFLDTANIEEIKKYAKIGIIDGCHDQSRTCCERG